MSRKEIEECGRFENVIKIFMTDDEIRREKSIDKLMSIYLDTLDDNEEYERNCTDKQFSTIGIDGFREFLEKYGHQGGDIC